MRIAFLNKYQNKVNRGAETYVYELAKRLSKNHEVDVISNINYLSLLKNKYDLIIPTNGREQVFLIRIITWLTNAKMMVSGQSGKGWDDRLNLYAMPDVFIALSTKALNWAKTVNPFVKSIYIPNGVDLKRFVVKVASKKQKQSTILSVGAFTKQKRHDLVVDAVSKLKDAKLIIAGSGGDLKNEIHDLGIKLLGEDRFEIVETSNDKMPAIYQMADVFTLASETSESFGIVLVEAMASGLPVVSTEDPVRREIVGEAGLFVDPTDAIAYSKVLEKTLQLDWGNKPRKQAEKFNWDSIALQYEDAIKSL